MSANNPRATRGITRIVVSELRLQARVGVNPGEQGAEQPVLVDVWLEIEDPERPEQSEQLADTVDYVTVARTVRRVVARRHYPLVETLAAEAARAVLALDRVTRVGLKLQKLACMRRASAAGVEVVVERTIAAERLRPTATAVAGGEPMDEEIVVLGGGAAGLSAALWCWRLGHPALLVDAGARLGGQLHLVHGRMPDLPGLPPSTGPELVERLERQFVGHDGRWLSARMKQLERSADGGWLLRLGARQGEDREMPTLTARAVILAQGSRRRALGVPGERELLGRGVLYTAARGAEEHAGRVVVVVGGGDSACENALILQRAGARVTLVHRGAALTARRQFTAEVLACPGIEVRNETSVSRFIGGQAMRGVALKGPEGAYEMPAEAALVRIGWQPNSEGLPPEWLDTRGFVRRQGEAEVAGASGGGGAGGGGAFVAGEISGPISSSVAAAFGSGSAAAMSAVRFLERG